MVNTYFYMYQQAVLSISSSNPPIFDDPNYD
jgi:hypothetical protein